MGRSFSLYRKAIAAFLAAALGLIALFIPGVTEWVSPETLHAASVVLAGVAALLVSDKIDGANVVDLAQVVIRSFRFDGIEVSESPATAAKAGDLVIPRGGGRDPLVVTPITPEGGAK